MNREKWGQRAQGNKEDKGKRENKGETRVTGGNNG